MKLLRLSTFHHVNQLLKQIGYYNHIICYTIWHIVPQPLGVQVCPELRDRFYNTIVKNDSLEALHATFLFLYCLQVLNFYEVNVWQSKHAVGVCVCACVRLCGDHDLILGWTYSASAQGTYMAVLPKRSSCLWKGPLPSLKLRLMSANKASRCSVIITQSSRRIVFFTFQLPTLITDNVSY